VKKTQYNSFKFSPIATAVALTISSQCVGNLALAGTGFGSGLTTTNTPVAVPSYYANSPSGPALVYVNGKLVPRTDATGLPDGSGLSVVAPSGTMLRKFVDTLPGFGAAKANNLGQYIPVAVPEKWANPLVTVIDPVSLLPVPVVTTDDYYEIAAVEFRERMHSDLPATGTRLRGYVQLETPANAATSQHVQLFYLPVGVAAAVPITDPAKITVLNPNGYVYAYDKPHHLGPVINASKGTAVRVKFTNYLPVGGKMFLPVDTTLAGAGFGPDGVTSYTQNRAGMHLVGGQAPWISAGSPHQWIAPAGEVAAYAAGIGKGASARTLTDMQDPGAGSTYLYFPNDLSARFSFIQDRSTGLTRLNAYAGLEAAYVVTDPTEQTLINGGTLSGGALVAPVVVAAGTIPADQIPLIIEDKTFVPANITQQDTKWDSAIWGAAGDLWFPHVYEPNQDPNLVAGGNPVGRWDYGPMFWPIFPVSTSKATPPSVSQVPEAYMDTPLINGTAYPSLTVEPKAYRMRILNASNDRYINLGLYKAAPDFVDVANTIPTAPLLNANGNPVVDAAGIQQYLKGTEVKMVPAAPIDALGNPPGWDVVKGAQLPLPQFGSTFPWNINAEPSGPTRAWPKDGRAGGAPDPTTSGPDFVVIGNDGGLLPQAVDIPPQPVTYESNRRSITVLNIYGYGLLLGPSERADTIVDFSKYAGQTLILYNDAPAPTPFNDPRNDYYTGNPDLTGQGGAYTTQPGYGPNTRTMMQIVVGSTKTSGGPLNAAALAAAMPAAYGASQPTPLVPEAAYNTAFGTTDGDNYGHVATGSAAQPNLNFAHSGAALALIPGPMNLITSGGAGTGSGSGYLSAPQVLITPTNGAGAGALATATINTVGQVNGVTLTAAGAGYTALPNVTFIPTSTVASIMVADGGTGYTAGDQVVFSGGGGTGAAATLTVSSTSPILTAPALGSFSGTVFTPSATSGSGYTVPPTVTFVGGGGTGASASATISSSAVTTGLIPTSAKGSGYSAATKATVNAPQTAGTTATATPVLGFALSPTISFTVGSAYDPLTTQAHIAAPDLLGGTQALATVVVDTLTNPGQILSVTLDPANPGSGYSVAPAITLTDVLNNLSATATATLAPTGQVFGANISTGGSGYTVAPTVSFSDASGTGAVAASTTLAGPAGVVTGLTISSVGTGYTSAPQVVFTDSVNPTHPTATSAAAQVTLATLAGTITGITVTKAGSGYSSAPSISFTGPTVAGVVTPTGGTGALATASIAASGVGAQASVLANNAASIPVLTKAEQELFDDYGRYNSTGGVELPLTLVGIQTTIPLSYIDAATEIIGDGEVQIWKLVDNGLWSNSVHFSMADVQLLNRVGWDGTVKAPANNELGWKDTLRLNPLEDVMVAVRAKRSTVPFGQPQSTRLLDPSTPVASPNPPVAPTALNPAIRYAAGLGFIADPLVVTQAGTMNSLTVGVGTQMLATTVNSATVPGSTTKNFDNEFTWGSAILGHAENDFTRPVVFNPVVTTPDPSTLSDPLGSGTLNWLDATPAPITPTVANPTGNAATLANPKNEIGFKLLQAPTTYSAVAGAYEVSGAFTPIATPYLALPANVTQYIEPAANVSPAAPAYFAYQVAGYNVAGATSSNIVIEAPPNAPTGPVTKNVLGLAPAFIAAATSTADVTVALNWVDNAVNETNYIVTKTAPGGVQTVTTLPPVANPLGGSPAATWLDAGPLLEGTLYQYDLIARNAFGDSKPILSGSLTTPISVPLAPTNLLAPLVIAPCPTTPTAVPVRCKPDNVNLSWTDAAFNETKYTLTRTGGPGATLTIDPLPGTTAADVLNATGSTLSYVDATVQEGYSYSYTVSAVNAVGMGSTSVSVVLPITAPTVASNLTALPDTTLDASGLYLDQAKLTWSDNAYNETGYQITRTVTAPANLAATAPVVIPVAGSLANNPMGTATSAWTASPTLTYTDTGLIDGVSYKWDIVGLNKSLQGTPSGSGPVATVSATMPGIVITPPTGLVATPNRAGSSIGLQWIDMSTNETDFLVEERSSTDGITWLPWAAVLPVITRSLAETAATGGTVTQSRAAIPTTTGLVYAFRVSARNLTNHSDSHPYLTVQSSLLAPTVPTAPVLAAPTVATNRRVTLTWSAAAATAGVSYSYLVTLNNAGVITTINSNTPSYNYRPTVAQLQAGISYSVQTVATAVRGAGATAFGTSTSLVSNLQTVKATAPAAAAVPTGLAATINATTGTVSLNWTTVTAAAGTTISYLVSVNGGAPVAMARGATLAVATGASYSVTVQSVATAIGLSTASVASAPITVDLTAAPIPNAPATLRVSPSTLNWTAPIALPGTGSTNVSYTYTAQMSVDAGITWTPLMLTPNTTRTLAALSPIGANYQYQVAAQASRYSLATSTPSAWISTVFNTVPVQSTVPTTSLLATRSIGVSWTNTSTNISGFTLQRRLGAGAWTNTPATLATITAVGTSYSYTDTVAAAGSYTYRLLATSLAGSTTNTAASIAVVTP
jgi:hypothetical protein